MLSELLYSCVRQCLSNALAESEMSTKWPNCAVSGESVCYSVYYSLGCEKYVFLGYIAKTATVKPQATEMCKKIKLTKTSKSALGNCHFHYYFFECMPKEKQLKMNKLT